MFQLNPYSLTCGFCCTYSLIPLLICVLGKQRKVAEYYKQQERLLEGFTEMETITETGGFPGALSEV